MIDATQLTKELQSVGSKVFTPELIGNLEKSKKEFEALNVELVGRLKPVASDIGNILAKEAPKLEAVANNIAGNLESSGIVNNLVGIGNDLKSALPRAGLDLNNGIKGISAVMNDFPKEMEPTVNRFLKSATTASFNLQAAIPGLQKPLSELAEGLPIAAEKLKPALESAAGGIANAITGSNIQANLNAAVLALPTPQAMAETIDAVSKAAKNVIPDLELVVSAEIETSLKTAMDGIKGDLGGITKELSGVLSNMKIPDFSVPNLGNIVNDNLSNITTQLNKNFSDVVNTITNSPISDVLHQANSTLSIVKSSLGLSLNTPDIDNIAKNVINQFTNNTVSDALNVLRNASNLNIDVTANISGLTSTLTNLQSQFGSVSSMLNKASELAGNLLKSTAIIPAVNNLAKVFPTLNNLEEVFAEMASALKQPTEVEVGWTKTYKNDIVTKDTIKPKGYYHYIILPDGSIQRDKSVGSDQKIKIAIVGGYNSNRGEGGFLTANSVTSEAAKAFKKLATQITGALPGINIYGIGDIASGNKKSDGELVNPGIQVSKIAKQIGARSDTTVIASSPSSGKSSSEAGKPIGPHVVYQQGFEYSTRNRLIQPALMKILNTAAVQTGLYVTIFSGGQMPLAEAKAKGGVPTIFNGYTVWVLPGGREQGERIGYTTRHDNGYAADIWLYTDSNRTNRLVPGVKENPPQKAVDFIRACKALGATGLGVGPNYMANTGVHIDIAPNQGAKWAKKDAPIPEWFAKI